MIVVDANVVVMALVDAGDRGDAARAAMVADDAWIAPAHMPLEVMRVLARAVRAGRLLVVDADAAARTLITMQVEYVGSDNALLQAVWGVRHNVASYDAAYLAVAVMYDVALVSFDDRLARAAERLRPGARVELL